MDHFSLSDIFLIFGIGQGFFLVFSINRIKNQYHSANRVLMTIIFIACIMLIGKVFSPQFEGDWKIRVYVLVDASVFIFGPLIFTYVKKLLKSDIGEFKMTWWHYLPLAIYLTYFGWSLTMDVPTFRTLISEKIPIVLFLTEALGLVSFFSYCSASVYAFIKDSKAKGVYSTPHSITVKQYLTYFLISISALCLFWLVSFFGLYFFRQSFSFVTYHWMWIITPVFFYIIGFFSLNKPEILRSNNSSRKNRLNEKEVIQLKLNLNKLIEDQQIFMQHDLTLKKLAEKLDTSSNNLSWLLNKEFNRSFYDFINQLRIDEFRNKIKKEEHATRTLLGLAMEVGFSSKSTFNKAFKTYLEVTPSDYVKNVENKAA